ncbi:MAG TPA: VWA domain-containing protein, partial [Pirellulaceae bacterium]|nr:VWA domain-containing protein [Pirellulaceae bacterium]
MLRTAAVFLFGLALARPFFAARQEEFDERQPLHAILLVDNSLSMGYESLEGTLLDKAKDRARQLIDKLPAGSRISIIPACGSREGISADPYDTKENALEALGRIEIVDRSASLVRAANEAKRASEAAPQLAKRIVFISDQQELNWRDARQGEAIKELPAIQVVDVGPADWENTWISDLRVQDGLADVETPTTIIVELQHHGPSARRDVQVTLAMGDAVIGEKSVTIEPGLGAREVDFEYVFNTITDLPEPDKPVFVPLKASITPDRLAADDQRFLAAPVVASLPVVFIDQYGPEREDAIAGRLGETRHLRKLLAPKTSRSDAPRQLISVRHITPDDLNQEVLADARLVIVAGVQSPQGMVELLHDYVKQGGRVVLAAGANFDPQSWNDAAWLDGEGILPLPLERQPIGEVPEVAGANVRPFFLSFESLANEPYFQLAGVAEAELRDLYAEPFFFKAVHVDASPLAVERFEQAESQRMKLAEEQNSALAKRRDELEAKERQGELAVVERQQLDDVRQELRTSGAAWLTWAAGVEVSAPQAVQMPRVLARYELDERPPFLVSRKIGRGEVVFCSTGLLSSWNTLPKSNTVLIFDRILRGMAQQTLPRRNYEATERITLPLPPGEQHLTATLVRPGSGESPEPLDVNNIGPDQRGVTVTGLFQRGVYRVAGFRPNLSADAALADDKPVWEVPLVVSGPGEESDLAPLTRDQFEQSAASANLRWISPGEEISLAGTAIRGQTMWWWLALLVLVLLLAEM